MGQLPPVKQQLVWATGAFIFLVLLLDYSPFLPALRSLTPTLSLPRIQHHITIKPHSIHDKSLGPVSRSYMDELLLDELSSGRLTPGQFDHALHDTTKANLKALERCLRSGHCKSPNQKKVVICLSWHFYWQSTGGVAGEEIWMRSIVQAMEAIGYTIVYVPYAEGTQDPTDLVRLYDALRPFTLAILAESVQVKWCFEDPNCIRSPENPNGVPLAAMLSMNLWYFSGHYLGKKWTLGIERVHGDSDFTYLGYSIEPECSKVPFLPVEDRKREAFVFGKKMSYFGPDKVAWDEEDWNVATSAPLGLKLIGAPYQKDTKNDPSIQPPKGMKDVGKLSPKKFISTIGQTQVLVGVGYPLLSPTPYDALCVGVPFINPIISWDENNPEDRSRWQSQHAVLKYENAPAVYNVKAHDAEGFAAALAAIKATPLRERFIPEDMKFENLVLRVQNVLEQDWLSLGRERYEEMKRTGADTEGIWVY